MNARWEMLRKWPSCRAFGLGFTAERNTIGATIHDPRQVVHYSLTLVLFTRRLLITHPRRINPKKGKS